ncbi:unnamed protein product [Bathycoccus prasinos]
MEKQTIASSLKHARFSGLMSPPSSLRSQSLSLYRKIHRAAALFPTESRTLFVRDRLQRACREKTTPGKEDQEERVRLAEIQLETILVQSEHLRKVFEDERVHARF